MLTPQDIAIATQRAAGATLRQIEASGIGVSDATASRRLSRPELRDLVEQIQQRTIAQALPQAADNITHAISSYRAPRTVQATLPDGSTDIIPNPDVDAQLREHGYKASLEILRATGILPSHTPSVLIQQIFHAEGDIHLDSAASTAMQHLGVIDISPVEGEAGE